MTKRPCPFSDSVPQQLKIYVRQKEIDLGVRREENMKQVHSRTMDLLMQGSTHPLCGGGGLGMDWSQRGGRGEQPSSPPTPCLPPSLGGGHPSGWSALKQCSNAGPAEPGQCHQCLGASCRPPTEACQFCERRVCGACVRQCLTCTGSFCHLCSTINYDAVEERVFCLGCAG